MDNKEPEETKGISVALNDGKKEMNSATIPIEWWFSREVIEKDPRHVLFFEQNKGEKESFHNSVRGRRYACEVGDAFKFLQLFSPGYHRLMVVVISGTGDKAEKRLDRYLRKENEYYSTSLDWTDTRNNELHEYGGDLIAATVEEFLVPQELFAKKPETKLGRMVWKWTNLLFEDEPRDRCHYRKRKALAFTLQPFMVLVYLLAVYAIGGTFYALYILLASFSVFLIGFRPCPILKEMYRAFTFTRYKESYPLGSIRTLDLF